MLVYRHWQWIPDRSGGCLSALILILQLCICLPTTAKTINFQSDEGYLNGSLDQHVNWTAPQWQVDLESETITEDGYSSAVYVEKTAPFQPGASYTVSAIFSFHEAAWDPETVKWKPLFNVGFLNQDKSPFTRNGNSIRISFDRNKSEYVADIQSDYGTPQGDNIKGKGGVSQSPPFSAESIGIHRAATSENSDLMSDRLKMVVKLTAGNTMNDWICVATIHNADTDTLVTTFTATGITFNADTLYGVIGMGQSDSNAKIAMRRVHSFTFSTSLLPLQESYAWSHHKKWFQRRLDLSLMRSEVL
ncbi:MAG: hypothetical protein AAF571_09115 [Verrucomicrobiota bacterium]